MRNIGIGLLLILATGVSLSSARENARAKSGVVKVPYGKTSDGQAVDLFVLTNSKGMTVKVITYGAAITEIWVPDRAGKLADVNLGFDDIKGWQSKGNPFFGCVVGRYANRIAKGSFSLDGKQYTLARNNGPNHLHGGLKGFDKVVWNARILESKDGPAVQFTHTSPDGDEGYPGKLSIEMTYTLTESNEIRIDYKATSDKPTVLNLTNHAYFNLAGHDAGDVLGHELTLISDKVTPTDENLIPTGKIESVKGTPYDFTSAKKIGKDIASIKADPVGYDINYVLADARREKPVLAATVHEPKSGRILEMLTTEPGVQLYTGNFLDGTVKGKGGAIYRKHAGFCLEAQVYPDSPNQPTFPSCVLRPGKTYTQTTVYRFSTK